MHDQLTAVEFQPEMLADIGNFDCGSESYQSELAGWLQNEASAVIVKGTKVWLYFNQAGDIVGFGSLGPTNWRYPEPTSKRTAVVLIPAVAIRREFWGKPENVELEERYSSQILRQLVDEAGAWPGNPPAVGLYVHPENQAAIKLYERFHFHQFHQAYTDPGTNVTYISFIRPLVPS